MSLKQLRKQKGLTIENLAKDLNISISYALKLDSGERKASMAILQKLKIAYPDVDANIFLMQTTHNV